MTDTQRFRAMQRLLTPQTNPDLRSTIHATARHWRWIAAALLASLAVAAALQAAAGAVAGQVAIVILAGVAAALAWVLLPRDSGTIAGGDARARRCAVAWLLASALLVIIAPLAWVGLFMFLWPIGLLYGAAVRAYTSRCTLIRGSVQ